VKIPPPAIHPAFRLDGYAFRSPVALLGYVEAHYPAHTAFLKKWFDRREEITLQTSGSTGKPKTIVFPKEKLLLSARRSIRFFRLPPGSEVLLNLHPDFVAAKMMWIRALAGGWALTVTGPKAPVPDKNFDFGAMVPRQAEKNSTALRRFKKLILGGAPVNKILEKRLQALPGAVWLTYGMTETLTHVAVRPLNRAAACGKFAPDRFHALPLVRFETDKEGCLLIHDRWLDMHLQVNDRVELLDDKHFRWLSRCDEVINTGGIKVYPAEIERKLEAFIPGIITSIPDETWGQKVVLVMEGTPVAVDKSLFERAGLKFYEKPKAVYFIGRFPETESGKIKRRAVKVEGLRRAEPG